MCKSVMLRQSFSFERGGLSFVVTHDIADVLSQLVQGLLDTIDLVDAFGAEGLVRPDPLAANSVEPGLLLQVLVVMWDTRHPLLLQ